MLRKMANYALMLALSAMASLSLIGLLSMSKSGLAWTVSWEVGKLGHSVLEFTLMSDIYSLSFMFTVGIISSAIYLFSLGYMESEKFFWRFHALVFSFVLSMLFLITSPNLISILLGWDGLGLTSYLLVIYFQSTKAFNAGMLTALSNRVGDVLILTSIGLYAYAGAWSFIPYCSSQISSLSISMGLILIAACTKSAQIPFSAWLPAAMAAPTPVSSLVHSSTLVTAGVYLLFRFCPRLYLSGLNVGLLLTGGITMVMAGLAALRETDMKKIVALSTLSQLGVMMFTLASGAYCVSFFHLLSHAFFKALLFMTVGAFIHMSHDYQDLRKIGLNAISCSLTLSFSIIANLSLCGLPFFSGFYSKDLCIEWTTVNGAILNTALIFYIATALTVAYSYRFIVLTIGNYFAKSSWLWENDYDLKMNYSMSILYPLALMAGSFFLNALMPFFKPIAMSLWEKNLTLMVIICGALVGAISVKWPVSKTSSGSLIFAMWALPLISTRFPAKMGAQQGFFVRLFLDLLWTPYVVKQSFLEIPSFISASESQAILNPWFMALAFGLILAALGLLYLHEMNLFIF